MDPFFPIRVDGSDSSAEDRENVVVLDEQNLAEMKASYDGEIAYTDHHLGRLIDDLQANELDRNTIVIVTADHGEEFWIMGVTGTDARCTMNC